MSLQELTAKVTEIKTKLSAESRKAFESEIGAFLAAHPELVGFHWTQWTPYFNDGEPCEFSRHEISAVYDAEGVDVTGIMRSKHYKDSINEAAKREVAFEFCDIFSRWSRVSRSREGGVFVPFPETAKEVHDFLVALQAVPDEVFEVLGEGVVVATRDGLELVETEHE